MIELSSWKQRGVILLFRVKSIATGLVFDIRKPHRLHHAWISFNVAWEKVKRQEMDMPLSKSLCCQRIAHWHTEIVHHNCEKELDAIPWGIPFSRSKVSHNLGFAPTSNVRFDISDRMQFYIAALIPMAWEVSERVHRVIPYHRLFDILGNRQYRFFIYIIVLCRQRHVVVE